VVYILFFSLLDTLKPFLIIIIINQIILSDATAPSCHFLTVDMKSSTLTNEIDDNLSLLGEGYSIIHHWLIMKNYLPVTEPT
jgi:hypothetical protein